MLEVDDESVKELLITLGKNEKSVHEDVAILEKWINEQPHFSKPLEKRSILNFLILNKFSIEKTKQKIDSYYTIRTGLTDIFQKYKPDLPHMKENREILYYVPHPRLFDNYRVVFYKLRRKDLSEKLDPYDLVRHVVAIFEIRLRKDIMYGDIGIFDCSDVPFSFYLKVTPALIYKFMVTIYQKIFSYRLKAFYFINFPTFAARLVTVLQQVLKPKLFERLHFVKDSSVLKKEFPDEFLPVDFGGKGPSLSQLQEMLEEEFQKNAEFFNQLDEFYVKENLRPVGLENDQMLGFYGNFKQLNVD